MPDHTEISPSGLSRVLACAGSVAAQAAVPPEERPGDSPQSTQGTRRHTLAAYRFDNPDKPNPTEVDGHQITGEDVFALNEVWPYVRDHPAYVGHRAGKPGFLAVSEKKLEIGKCIGLDPGIITGTIDLGFVSPGVVEVADWKFGYFPVDPDSWQLKAYALGFMRSLVDESTGLFLPEYAQVRNLKLTILQPTDSVKVKTVEFDIFRASKEWMQAIKDGVKRALQPGAPRHAGSHCKFCAAAETFRCDTYLRSIGDGLQGSNTSVPVTSGGQPVIMAKPDVREISHVDLIDDVVNTKLTRNPEDLSLDEIGRLLDQEGLVVGFFKNLRQHAQKLREGGQRIPGWKLVHGKGSREWIPDEKEIVTEFKKWQLKKAEYYPDILISPAQAEKLPKIVNSKTYSKRLAEMVRKKEGKPTLVPEEDPRPEIRDVTQMFEDETEPEGPTLAPNEGVILMPWEM